MMNHKSDCAIYNEPAYLKGEGDCMTTCEMKQVIFNPPATIVLWSDGTKTVVKTNNEEFDWEKGFAMALCKKVLGEDYKATFKHVEKTLMKIKIGE